MYQKSERGERDNIRGIEDYIQLIERLEENKAHRAENGMLTFGQITARTPLSAFLTIDSFFVSPGIDFEKREPDNIKISTKITLIVKDIIKFSSH